MSNPENKFGLIDQEKKQLNFGKKEWLKKLSIGGMDFYKKDSKSLTVDFLKKRIIFYNPKDRVYKERKIGE